MKSRRKIQRDRKDSVDANRHVDDDEEKEAADFADGIVRDSAPKRPIVSGMKGEGEERATKGRSSPRFEFECLSVRWLGALCEPEVEKREERHEEERKVAKKRLETRPNRFRKIGNKKKEKE